MRIALGIEYDGSSFRGWQAQEHLLTVQGCVEAALSRIANNPIKVVCAGRTDAGVHAIGQVIHFDTTAERALQAWVVGTNSFLPNTIAVQWSQEVDSTFSARFSALSRSYRYLVYNSLKQPAILFHKVTRFSVPLDIVAMQKAADFLMGELDFSSFRSAQCESKTPMREVQHITISRANEMVMIDITANAFLHHMVRNIVGVLLKIGAGAKPAEWMQAVLLAKDRKKAAETAPPEGLYLKKVTYKSDYHLPEKNNENLFAI